LVFKRQNSTFKVYPPNPSRIMIILSVLIDVKCFLSMKYFLLIASVFLLYSHHACLVIQAYGMSVLPLELIKGYRTIKVCTVCKFT
jgi:hypothetical protein